jgi:hypothetical protein
MKIKMAVLAALAIALAAGAIYFVSRPAEHHEGYYQKAVGAAERHVAETGKSLEEVEQLNDDYDKEMKQAHDYKARAIFALHAAKHDLAERNMSGFNFEMSLIKDYEKEWKAHLHNAEEDDRRVESLESGR